MQVHALEHGAAVAVAKVDVREGDIPAKDRQLHRVGCIRNAGLQVEELEDALQPRPSLLADREDSGKLPRRRHELGDVRREGQEGPEGDVVLQHEPPSQREDRRLREHRDRLEERLIPRLEPDGPHLRAVQDLGGVGNAFELAALLRECLHHTDTVQILVDDLHQVTLSLLAVPGRGEDPPAHAIRDKEQARRHDEAHHGEQRRQIDHDGERQHQQDHVAAHDREEVEQPLDERRVRVGASDQLTRRHAAQVLEVHGLQVVVHVVAEVVLDLERDAATAISPDVRETEAGRREAEQQQQQRPERRPVRDDDAVDDLPRHQRHRRLRNAPEHGGPDGERHVTSVAEHVAPESPYPTRLRGLLGQPCSLFRWYGDADAENTTLRDEAVSSAAARSGPSGAQSAR